MHQATMPHSKESEMMVLGSMLTNNDALKICADLLSKADFYFMEHRSHGADAFRMLAVGVRKLVNKGLTATQWRNLRQQYIG